MKNRGIFLKYKKADNKNMNTDTKKYMIEKLNSESIL